MFILIDSVSLFADILEEITAMSTTTRMRKAKRDLERKRKQQLEQIQKRLAEKRAESSGDEDEDSRDTG